MKLLSKSAKAKLGLKKTAGYSFMPLHHTDESYSNFSSGGSAQTRQQTIMDIVFREQGNGGISPLLDLFLKQTQTPSKYVSAGDKSLLIKAWETSKSISKADNQAGDRLLIGSEFSNTELNQLKSAGLITGSGNEILLTAKGRETLVKVFLDDEDEGSFTKAAANIVKIVKMASAEDSNEKFMERAEAVSDHFNRDDLELDLGNGYKLVKDPASGKLVKAPSGK